jgi:hypothetical protein
LITSVKIRFIRTTQNLLFFGIPDIILIHQVSDKRLLKRCGGRESYLIETGTASFRPPGMRIRRAEVRTKGPRVPDARQIDENRKRSFRDWVTGLQEMKGFGPGLPETDAISFGKCAPAPERHFVPESRFGGRKDSRKVLL